MDSKRLPLATASILGQALIKQRCNLLKLLITHFDCLLRDSAAPPAVWGLLDKYALLRTNIFRGINNANG